MLCAYGGTCYIDTNGDPKCNCTEQYQGENCMEGMKQVYNTIRFGKWSVPLTFIVYPLLSDGPLVTGNCRDIHLFCFCFIHLYLIFWYQVVVKFFYDVNYFMKRIISFYSYSVILSKYQKQNEYSKMVLI